MLLTYADILENLLIGARGSLTASSSDVTHTQNITRHIQHCITYITSRIHLFPKGDKVKGSVSPAV